MKSRLQWIFWVLISFSFQRNNWRLSTKFLAQNWSKWAEVQSSLLHHILHAVVIDVKSKVLASQLFWRIFYDVDKHRSRLDIEFAYRDACTENEMSVICFLSSSERNGLKPLRSHSAEEASVIFLLHGYLLHRKRNIGEERWKIMNICMYLLNVCCRENGGTNPYHVIAAVNLALSGLAESNCVTSEDDIEEILRKVLTVVHCHWNSRYRSVSDKLIPETMERWTDLGTMFFDGFPLTVLRFYVFKVPYYVKGRYRMILCQLKKCSSAEV